MAHVGHTPDVRCARLCWCRSLLYQMAMNVSNLVAIACVCLWASSPLAPTVARYFSVAAIMVFVYERQKEPRGGGKRLTPSVNVRCGR